VKADVSGTEAGVRKAHYGAVSYLHAHSDEFELRLGGARNFGAGIADVTLVNPLYTNAEVCRVFNRGQAATTVAIKYQNLQ